MPLGCGRTVGFDDVAASRALALDCRIDANLGFPRLPSRPKEFNSRPVVPGLTLYTTATRVLILEMNRPHHIGWELSAAHLVVDREQESTGDNKTAWSFFSAV